MNNKAKEENLTQEEIVDRAQAIIQSSAFCRELGIELVSCEQDHAVGRIILNERHGNPLGDVHGGVLFALADTICGIAACSRGSGGPTVSGFMDFLRPVQCKELICKASVVKHGSSLIRAECVMTDENGKELARGYSVFLATSLYRDFRTSNLSVHKDFT